MKISIKTVFMSFIFTLLLSVFITDYAEARNRSFPAGSYIIPADACWQPNNDPNMAKQDNACDTDKNDQSIFQLHGLLYALLDVGDQPGLCKNNDGSMPQQKALFGYCKQIRVNWVIDAEKDSQHTDDLVLSTTDTAINSKGIVQILNSKKLTKAGTSTKPVAYRGGPFVIDVNDITTAEMEKLKEKFPSVKIHKANIPFSGNVDKVLVGKPPKVAVLDEIPQGQSNVSSDVLEDYIRASGLFSWKGTVFQKLSARDVIAGCLRDPVPASCKAQRPDISSSFQLLWAPHWVIEEKWSDGKVATAADQTAVIKEIRDFFERGSSGFFQCSSIGSLEGSKILTNGDTIGKNISAGVGGFLVGNENTWPRLDVNGGCFKGYNNSSSGNCSSDYLQFEEAPFWLTQCGGWEFKPGQGGVDSMRPSSGSGYVYHSTDKTDKTSHYVGSQLTRFIHDNPAKLNKKYTAANDGYYVYDYLVGGRINGSPTQGYVIYFPGHKYVTCKTQRNYGYPPSRNIDFQFDKIPEGEIKVELVHGKCTQGNNCPTISYGSGNGADLVSADTWVTLNAEFAFLNSGSKRLEGIYFTSNFDDTTLTELQISKIRVFFNGGSDTEDKARLLAVADVTQAGSRQVLCSPNATATTSSPVECSSTGKPATVLSMNFDEDISTAIVNKPVKVIIPVKGQSNRLEATFDVTTSTGTRSSTIGNLTLDLTNAVYDSGTYTLGNIVLERGNSCADITLSDILVDFPGTGIKLVAVYNNSTNEEVCTANSTAVAVCSTPQTPLPNNSIKTSLNFNTAYFSTSSSSTNSKNIILQVDYDCEPACSTSSVSATYTTSTRTKSGNTVSNTDITLDMSGASFTNSNKTLNNITITNKDQSKQLVIRSLTLTYDTSKRNVQFKDITNSNTVMATWTANQSPSTISGLSHIVKNNTTIEAPDSTWSYLIGRGICSDYKISPYMSSCEIDWNANYGNGKASNTCGAKFVLNTLLALKFQTVSNEFSKTQPIVKDNIMYKASYDYPEYRGHLRMIKVPTNIQAAETVWDAADSVPAAGGSGSGFKSAPLSSKDTTSPRYIFTTEPGATKRENFDAENWSKLASLLGTNGQDDTKVVINSVRGRADATTNEPFGTKEDSKRLWAIENSTPALKTVSRYVESTSAMVTKQSIDDGRDRRDRVLFAGAADGMLHAFWAGSYDEKTGGYPDTINGRGNGKEIWAYIPSALLPKLKEQPFNPDPEDEVTFEPKVQVDGSPSLADFLVCNDGTAKACKSWVWKTRLVGTARIDDANRGVIFALDVTDPYDPKPLWESSYDDTTNTAACGGSDKNCNMGNSKGVAIGSTQVGSELKNYAYLTASWISRKNKDKPLKIDGKEVDGQYETCNDKTKPECVRGITAYALDLENGNIVWARDLPYTGDAVNVNDTPAVPALMDKDNNGSYDYVVFGDMQGRLWALRTTDGKNLTGKDPVYEVKKLDANGKDTTVKAGADEPIGASVAVYRDYVVLATGGADSASDGNGDDKRTYRVEVVKIGQKGATKLDNFTILLDPSTNYVKSEKVWAQPTITADSKIYIATARNYTSTASSMASVGSEGRIIVMDLKKERGAQTTPENATTAEAKDTNVTVVEGIDGQWIAGGFVGGFDFDSKHGYVVTLNPDSKDAGKSFIQLGNKTDFKSSSGSSNPYKVLWWKKL